MVGSVPLLSIGKGEGVLYIFCTFLSRATRMGPKGYFWQYLERVPMLQKWEALCLHFRYFFCIFMFGLVDKGGSRSVFGRGLLFLNILCTFLSRATKRYEKTPFAPSKNGTAPAKITKGWKLAAAQLRAVHSYDVIFLGLLNPFFHQCAFFCNS